MNSNIPISTHLAPWNEASLNRMMSVFNLEFPAVNDRVHAWCRFLLNTPFEYESTFPFQPGELTIRLSTLDCITFVYNIIALAGSTSFQDFVRRLYTIRYHHTPTENPVKVLHSDNFLDFACEALLFKCVDEKLLVDVTEDCFDKESLQRIQMQLQPLRRPIKHDPKEQYVYPKYANRNIDTMVLPSSQIGVQRGFIKPGDLILFTKGVTDQSGKKNCTFVCHCAFADVNKSGEVVFIHSTKSYYTTDITTVLTEEHQFLLGHPEKKLPGVAYGCEYLGDEKIVTVNGINYHGYNHNKKRSLSDYASENFYGIKVLRAL